MVFDHIGEGASTQTGPTVRTPAEAAHKKLVYIAGTSYSGSTLLSLLLNAQRKISSVGEVAWSVPRRGAENYPCSCGATLGTCAFWSDISSRMRQLGHKFNTNNWDMAFEVTGNKLIHKLSVSTLGNNTADALRDTLLRMVPRYGARLKEIGERNKSFMQCILEATDGAAFVDASKDPNRVRHLRKYAGVEPYVIHLVRDAPGLVSSVLRQGASERRFRMAIQWWNSTARRIERLKSTTDSKHWLVVRYEDLCANPAGQLSAILDFMGLKSSDPIVNFRSSAHHIIGNRMRLKNASNITLDSSWRTLLTGEQIRQIRAQTKKYRSRFGYGDA